MTVVWCDVETTGLEPINSGAFEIAMIIYRGGVVLAEKVFLLNPLDDEVLYHEGAYKAHGVLKETIESYPPISEIVPEIAEFLELYMLGDEKLVFAGYNCGFDYGHISATFFRGGGFQMSDYFNGKMIDVFEKVKKAQELKILPKTPNQKLPTMTKALGIPHSDAHSALSDIKATRRLYETIYSIERSKRV